jgi:hypothetical protein
MIKLKNILFASIIVIILFLSIAPVAVNAQTAPPENTAPVLELVYPKIPNDLREEIIAHGLPGYIGYMFKLSMVLIGIIILLVLIFNGFKWFTSFGSADKLISAKQGILSALLGAIILFSSYILFNTINPQLTILKVDNADLLEPVIPPGIYLCDYNANSVTNIDDLITSYKGDDKEQSLKAVKLFKTLIKNERGNCYLTTSSGNLIRDISGGPVIAIPEKTYEYSEITRKPEAKWLYRYGIVFHEKDYYRGQCSAWIPTEEKGISPAKISYGISYKDKKVRSITLYKLPEAEASSNSNGIVFYQCLNYNDKNNPLCPEGVTAPESYSFYPSQLEGQTARQISEEDLTGVKLIKDGHSEIRSITVDPEGYYFALLFSEDNLKGDRCEIISKNDNSLLDQPIGQCGDTCNAIVNNKNATQQQLIAKCFPCTKSILIIKGAIF